LLKKAVVGEETHKLYEDAHVAWGRYKALGESLDLIDRIFREEQNGKKENRENT